MRREMLILGLLRKENMHGYRLAEWIHHNLGDSAELKRPTAYFVLEKMTACGLVTFADHQQDHRPTKRVYSITRQGELEFFRLLREALAALPPNGFDVDVALAFVMELPADEAVELLTARSLAIENRLGQLQQAEGHTGPAGWMVEQQLRHYETERVWTHELIQRIQANPWRPGENRIFQNSMTS